uniref:Uncharacterized protein n=1 Tax=Arundo donax TaxID=35708 RepID=A0A0A9HJL7_ARUDO
MAMLTSKQLAYIGALGFVQLLSMEVDAVESRNLLPWLMDRVDPDTMVMCIGPGKVLHINAQVVIIGLGLPNIGTNLRHQSWMEGVQAWRDLVHELALEDGSPIDIYRLMEQLLMGHVDNLCMWSFCLVLFNRLVFPGSSYDTSK